MGVRRNNSESVQVLLGYSSPQYCKVMAKFLSRCKGLSVCPGILMVKVVIYSSGYDGSRNEHAVHQGALTRYPCRPHRGHREPGMRTHPGGCVAGTQLYIEIVGRFAALQTACQQAIVWSQALLGRPPDYIAQRLGRSNACRAAQIFLEQRTLRAHYFNTVRWQNVRLEKFFHTHSSLYVHICCDVLLHLQKWLIMRCLMQTLKSKELLVHIVMDFLWPRSWEQCHLTETVRDTMFACLIHVRMFNDVPDGSNEDDVLREFWSLDTWAERAQTVYHWHVHPFTV